MTRRGRLRLALPFLLLAAAPVEAHLVETGFGEYYDGIVHFAVTPVDVLVVFALALLAGQRGARAGRIAALVLPLAWLLAGLLGQRLELAAGLSTATTLGFALIGALVALDAKLSDGTVLALALAAGTLHGLVNGATMSAGDSGIGLALAGAASAALLLCVVLAGEVSALRLHWQRVAVRVAGSWMTALGMLMLGWLLLSART